MATRRTPGGSGPSTPRPGGPGKRGVSTTRTRTKATPKQEAAARTRFTSRMGILVLVVAVLVISYASSLQAYLVQRNQINELQQSIATSKAAIKKLEQEKERWDDDVYVQSQARARFGWVLPGERTFQVIGKDGKPLNPNGQLVDPKTVAQPKPVAWWEKVTSSIATVDNPPKEEKPAVTITPPSKRAEQK
jgi:cell division protein FtsB